MSGVSRFLKDDFGQQPAQVNNADRGSRQQMLENIVRELHAIL
jgi:hypothetical protein